MATEENPVPTDDFHSCLGPSCGQETDQPVSVEMPLNPAPRQRGQSLAMATDEAAADRIDAAIQAMGPLSISASHKRRRRRARARRWMNMAAQLTDAGSSVKPS